MADDGFPHLEHWCMPANEYNKCLPWKHEFGCMQIMVRDGEMYVRQILKAYQTRNEGILQMMLRLYHKFGKDLPDADWTIDATDGDHVAVDGNNGVWAM